MKKISIRTPDDFHVHFRDDEALQVVAPHTAQQFARAMVMPNLRLPICTTAQAMSYKQRIMATLPSETKFKPLMSLYLTDNLPATEIKLAKEAGILALKLYPAGATTNSDAGVTSISAIKTTLEAMEREGLLLLVHGEVTDSRVDIFDREMVFIDQVLEPLRHQFPELKIVLEHITTKYSADYVTSINNENLAASITAHHLLYNRNALFKNGFQPHYYCLPVLKREENRQSLLQAVASGSSRFFLGTDSAPHASILKERENGCAGCYTAYSAIELYAKALDDFGCLDKLNAFASEYGANFYGIPLNEGTITMCKEDWTVPTHFSYGGAKLKPLAAGEIISWRVM
jgi:dihydroorotase